MNLDQIEVALGFEFRDADGKRITRERFIELMEDNEYRTIGRDFVFDPPTSPPDHVPDFISTVWLGYPSAKGCFETLISCGHFHEPVRQYRTKEEAKQGHAEFVALVRRKEVQASLRLGEDISKWLD